MKRWVRLMYVVTWVAMAVVAVSSILAAVRQGSWGPVLSVAWLPAVIVASWPGNYRRLCMPRRSGQVG